MRIIVSDSSCLIDLRKASLLEALLKLPYETLIPNTLFEEELFKFTAEQKETLVTGGLQVVDLPGERVLRAQAVVRDRTCQSTTASRSLSRKAVRDAFCLPETAGFGGLRPNIRWKFMACYG